MPTASRLTTEKSLAPSSPLPPIRCRYGFIRALRAWQLELSQWPLTCQMLPSLTHLCDPLLDLLQGVHASCTEEPRTDGTFRVRPPCDEGRRIITSLALRLHLANAARCVPGFLWCRGTLLAHTHLVHQDLQVFLCKALSRWPAPNPSLLCNSFLKNRQDGPDQTHSVI